MGIDGLRRDPLIQAFIDSKMVLGIAIRLASVELLRKADQTDARFAQTLDLGCPPDLFEFRKKISKTLASRVISASSSIGLVLPQAFILKL